MLQMEISVGQCSRSGLPSMPKGDIVGMFTDRRQSMLVIDGKNNSDDATSMENKMERTTTMLAE
jgi:hypothetical protein